MDVESRLRHLEAQLKDLSQKIIWPQTVELPGGRKFIHNGRLPIVCKYSDRDDYYYEEGGFFLTSDELDIVTSVQKPKRTNNKPTIRVIIHVHPVPFGEDQKNG